MIYRRKSESHWQSVSDLMTGLMVIFLFVALGLIWENHKTKQNYNFIKDKIYEDIKKEFTPEEISRWGTSIDPQTLTVSFVEPMVFFANDDATVNPHFQRVLTEFMPRYLEVLEKYKDDIVEVRIEGNASLEWAGDVNSPAAYFGNMRLSQSRAFNVLQYIYGIPAIEKYRPFMREKLRANGASYSKATQNAAASRSVEISIRRDAEKAMESMK